MGKGCVSVGGKAGKEEEEEEEEQGKIFTADTPKEIPLLPPISHKKVEKKKGEGISLWNVV